MTDNKAFLFDTFRDALHWAADAPFEDYQVGKVSYSAKLIADLIDTLDVRSMISSEVSGNVVSMSGKESLEVLSFLTGRKFGTRDVELAFADAAKPVFSPVEHDVVRLRKAVLQNSGFDADKNEHVFKATAHIAEALCRSQVMDQGDVTNALKGIHALIKIAEKIRKKLGPVDLWPDYTATADIIPFAPPRPTSTIAEDRYQFNKCLEVIQPLRRALFETPVPPSNERVTSLAKARAAKAAANADFAGAK